MKTKIVLLLLITASVTSTRAQLEANNWYFGYYAGITFSTTPPTMLTGGQINTYEGCATISDATGKLLFYTDGSTVWDSTHTPMPNGTGLNSGTTSSQAALIIPMPGSSTLYYIFTPPQNAQGFYYSIVDITLNNGKGDVTVKNSFVFSPATERVTAAYHANGTDVWVIGHPYNSSDFRAYLFTSAGLAATPVITTIGSFHGNSLFNGIGCMKTSPCGGKLAVAILGMGLVELFDFDNATGVFSNGITLDTLAVGNPWGLYGVEFSPDGSKLYVSVEHPAVITQYDINAGSAAAIIASATVVYSQPAPYMGALQNGPDGKMYCAQVNAHYLAVIDYPNNPGVSCFFNDSAIFLGAGIAYHGLPSCFSPLFCGLNVNTNHPDSPVSIISLYPNPASTSITVSLSANTTTSTHISIANTLGEQLFQRSVTLEKLNNTITIPLTNFAKGIYFLRVQTKDGVEVKKFVVE